MTRFCTGDDISLDPNYKNYSDVTKEFGPGPYRIHEVKGNIWSRMSYVCSTKEAKNQGRDFLVPLQWVRKTTMQEQTIVATLKKPEYLMVLRNLMGGIGKTHYEVEAGTYQLRRIENPLLGPTGEDWYEVVEPFILSHEGRTYISKLVERASWWETFSVLGQSIDISTVSTEMSRKEVYEKNKTRDTCCRCDKATVQRDLLTGTIWHCSCID
ncbi:MAG TPA: hypothetical protein ENI23_02100 [bacterium]|nr:hypothetical protein [bacterium]